MPPAKEIKIERWVLPGHSLLSYDPNRRPSVHGPWLFSPRTVPSRWAYTQPHPIQITEEVTCTVVWTQEKNKVRKREDRAWGMKLGWQVSHRDQGHVPSYRKASWSIQDSGRPLSLFPPHSSHARVTAITIYVVVSSFLSFLMEAGITLSSYFALSQASTRKCLPFFFLFF